MRTIIIIFFGLIVSLATVRGALPALDPDDGGVPNRKPPLVGSPVIAGDTAHLINVLLQGPDISQPFRADARTACSAGW